MEDWFAHCTSLPEARAEYRRLCQQHHPDHGGDTLVMQAINDAYTRTKRALHTPRPARASGRHWQRPRREKPRDVAPATTAAPHDQPPPAMHSLEHVREVWQHTPWQTHNGGAVSRSLGGHTITLLQHPARFGKAWFVMLDNTFSPYFYDSRIDAEHAAFDILYNAVKHQPL
jgi:hypothetical protein